MKYSQYANEKARFISVVKEKINARSDDNDIDNDKYSNDKKTDNNIEYEYDSDNPNIDLLERYQFRTPNMLKASDVWSIGVIAFAMVTGRAPFDGRSNRAIFESIVTRPWKIPAKDARYGNDLDDTYITPQFLVCVLYILYLVCH